MFIHTIDGFDQLSRQQIFDMAVEHIQKTRTKSTKDDSAACLYAGIGCAASVFLKPESRAMMDRSGDWKSLVSRKGVPDHEAHLIAQLQDAHDSADACNFMTHWSINMHRVADNNNLDTAKLEKL
jgi:hypothetical protein